MCESWMCNHENHFIIWRWKLAKLNKLLHSSKMSEFPSTTHTHTRRMKVCILMSWLYWCALILSRSSGTDLRAEHWTILHPHCWHFLLFCHIYTCFMEMHLFFLKRHDCFYIFSLFHFTSLCCFYLLPTSIHRKQWWTVTDMCSDILTWLLSNG